MSESIKQDLYIAVMSFSPSVRVYMANLIARGLRAHGIEVMDDSIRTNSYGEIKDGFAAVGGVSISEHMVSSPPADTFPAPAMVRPAVARTTIPGQVAISLISRPNLGKSTIGYWLEDILRTSHDITDIRATYLDDNLAAAADNAEWIHHNLAQISKKARVVLCLLQEVRSEPLHELLNSMDGFPIPGTQK